MIESLYCRLFD